MKNLKQLSIVTLLLLLLYCFLRYPIIPLNLAFYDDGEALYRTFAMLQGRIPHRDDINHHFSGYLIHFLLGAKAFGFSDFLIAQVALVNQVLVGAGVYLCLRYFLSFWPAMLGAALAISAREPYVFSFYVQHEINLLTVFSLLAALHAQSKRHLRYLAICSMIAGLAFVYDQRALALSFIPFSCGLLFLGSGIKHFTKGVLIAVGSWFVPVGAALFYLWHHDALLALYEQSFVFPTLHRVGGSSLSELLLQGIDINSYLVTKTPILFTTAIIGFTGLFCWLQKAEQQQRARYLMLLATFIPLAVMPLFGGRDFDYYSFTWLPYLAILSALSLKWFKNSGTLFKSTYSIVLLSPIIFSVIACIQIINRGEVAQYSGDGINQLTNFLKKEIKADETLFVWGYRLEIYPRVRKTSPYPFSNLIFIQPDKNYEDQEKNELHIYPKYEKQFLSMLDNSPPDYVVNFQREGKAPYNSKSSQKLDFLLSTQYKVVKKIRGLDFQKKKIRFTVYKKNKPTPSIESNPWYEQLDTLPLLPNLALPNSAAAP